MAREVAIAMELSELSRTPEVDWRLWVSHDNGKGPELTLESTKGQELPECNSCKRVGWNVYGLR